MKMCLAYARQLGYCVNWHLDVLDKESIIYGWLIDKLGW